MRFSDTKPYRTEVQFHRAMEAIFYSLNLTTVKPEHTAHVVELALMIGNSALKFFKSYGMEIEDTRTVYRKCTRSLVTTDDEPGLCLLNDWHDVISTQNA
jgi:hypothetical protein